MKLKFFLPEHGGSLEDAHEHHVELMGGGEEIDIEDAAEQFAEHFADEHDGWDYTWPIVFTVHDMEDNFLGNVKVELESRPHFSGRKVE